ncbi:hypothetical protein CBER1_03087 [Cercospora berteroae]|uniref:Uncharacterized protein n=1 Tax=Cercospora berteroae TaxID=357750 RepID=A0A2S6CHG2_9PEZI|nr:hypothetical protein CBER1_03087 [Cercospora berteroae]
MAPAQSRIDNAAREGDENHHNDDYDPNERRAVADYDVPHTREVVWHRGAKSLQFVRLYAMREVAASFIEKDVPSVPAQSIHLGTDGPPTSIALFEHPDKNFQAVQVCTSTDVLKGPHRSKLLALGSPAPPTFTTNMLVLAKHDDQTYYPTEIFNINDDGARCQVQFLARLFGQLTKVKVVKPEELLPLSNKSGLRVHLTLGKYSGYFPTNQKAPTLVKLGRIGDLAPGSKGRIVRQAPKARKQRPSKKGGRK